MKNNRQGSATLMVLAILTVVSLLVGIVLTTTLTQARNTDRSRDYIAAQACSEGAVEYAYAVWLKRTNNKHSKLYSSSDLSMDTYPTFTGTNAPAGTQGFTYATGGALTIKGLDKYGVAVAAGTSPDGVIGPVPGYPGWWGTTYTYSATARIQSVNGSFSAGVRRLFQYTEVSMFQTMYFFNDDLEIYNPATIVLSGLIHSNKALYLSVGSSTDLKINGNASTAGSLPTGYTPDYAGVAGFSSKEPPLAKSSNYDQGNLAVPTWNNGGASTQLHQVPVIQPLGTQITSLFPAPYGTNTASGATTDPNLMSGYHELIEPPSSASTDPTELAQRRLFNNAGLIIQITGTTRSGTSKKFAASDIAITTASVNSSTSAVTITPVSGKTVLVAALQGATLPTNTASTAYTTALNSLVNVLNKQLSTDTTPLYDQRVGSNVNVINLDVGNLNSFIYNNMTGNFNGVVYVHDTTTSSQANTIRLQNGAILPNNDDLLAVKGSAYTALAVTDGLTVASQNPIYIKGDYNTGISPPSSGSSPTSTSTPTGTDNIQSGSPAYTRLPAAVIGDALMLLSNAWTDANSPSYSNRDASNTTYNTALLGGYMLSQSGNFSGGAINYPRFLENWSGNYCTYWGSMVELFPSKTFTQLWQAPGTYYSPPTRFYNYDPNFSHSAPPGSVCAIVLSRGTWIRY